MILVLKAFNFKFDFRHALLAEKLDIYFTYIIPLLNSKIIEKYKHITYVIQDLLNENFSQWFIYENKELMAASSNFTKFSSSKTINISFAK